MFLTETDPAYWQDRPLTYSRHAEMRLIERSIPKIPLLPASARLVDVDKHANGGPYAATFKVAVENDEYFLVLVLSTGVVMTLYRNDKVKNRRMRCRKEHYRSQSSEHCIYDRGLLA